MKATIDIDDALLPQLEAKRQTEGCSLDDVINKALRRSLERSERRINAPYFPKAGRVITSADVYRILEDE